MITNNDEGDYLPQFKLLTAIFSYFNRTLILSEKL